MVELLDKWVKEFMIFNDWGVIMIYGIFIGYDVFIFLDILWEYFCRVKNQEYDIWVGIFCEVVVYVKEWRNV